MSCSITRKVLCGKCEVCLERSFASSSRAGNWSSKNKLKPSQVLLCSNKKYIFDCEECGHELELTLTHINSGSWCAYCNKSGLCQKKDCDFCYQKSFASHPMARNWSDRNEFTARSVCRGSEKKAIFDCDTCNHSFERVLYSMKNDNHCPYCSNQRLCKEDCKYCFDKSCASHLQMSQAWSSLNDISPRNVFLQANKKYIFNCLVCKHLYETTANHYYNRNGSCAYCSNHKLCEDADCDTCFNKSFASHPKANCWSEKNTVSSRMIFKGAEKDGIFNCDICSSEFKSKLYNVLTGYWCPYCKNKSEKKMLAVLRNKYPDCKTQLRFDWCRYSATGNIMPFDFSIGNTLIELDGAQHFEQISNWGSYENIQMKDIEKINAALENGYHVIHIYQVDVWNDAYDWASILIKEIERCKENKETECVFISTKNNYENHYKTLQKYKVINPLL
jgi:hypothetical protein